MAEEGILSEVRRRRRQLSGATIALDPDAAKHRIPDGDYLVSRKVDGEFTCLVWREGQICTLNPGGTLRANAPFLKEAAEHLKDVKSALIGGELYVQRTDGERPRVHDVVRVARNPQSEADVAQLGFAAFDIYELDGDDISENYTAAYSKLQELFGKGKLIHPVETVARETASTILKQFKTWVLEEGEEGIVARSPVAGIYKIKPRHSLDLAVVGFSEGMEDRAGMVHDLLCAIVRKSGKFHLVAKVGGGFSDEERAKLAKELTKRVVESDFHEVNSDRVGYQMIDPGLVIEIECLDIISRTSRGNTIEKMILDWTGSGWEGVRRLPLASILSPQFIRVRDDKTPSAEDTGVMQLNSVVEIPEIDRVAKEVALPKSEVIARAVAVKEAKGATMVRKVLAIKTNKDEANADFPAYVLNVTDFSPNRARKLQTEVKVSIDKEQILELFEHAKAAKFKKGWTEL